MAQAKCTYTSGVTSAEGTECKQKITRKKQLYLLFYTTGNDRGDNMMYYSAKTRRRNLENTKGFNQKFHLVFNIPIQDIAEIITTVHSSIKKRGGIGNVNVKEICIFSHAWFDGPRGSTLSSVENIGHGQMNIKGGWDSIDFQWAKNARFVMFGCNTATDEMGFDGDIPNPKRCFAHELSQTDNFKNVNVWGQPSPAKPSSLPDKRNTTIERSMDLKSGWVNGSCYMVAGSKGDGTQAIIRPTSFSIDARKMKKFKNGMLISRNYQSEFNEHRTRNNSL